VNLGALLGGYLCIAIGKQQLFQNFIPAALAWHVAFGLAAVVMVVSLLTFTQTQKSIASIGNSPILHLTAQRKRTYELITYAASLLVIPIIIAMVSNPGYTDLFMYIVGPCSLIYLLYEMKNYSVKENKRLFAAILFMLFSIFFWAFFEQSGGSLSLFAANNLSNNLMGMKLDQNGVNNSANSLFVIVFAGLFGLTWIGMNKRKMEPNTIVKFGLAFIFLAGGFYIFYMTRFYSDANGITSLDLFTFGWLIITFGELCLSPIGMSVMTKLSPPKLQAVIMGMWFLASAYGQYFAGILGANIAEASRNSTNLEQLMVYTEGYRQLAVYSLIGGIFIVVISPLIKRLMGEVK
jgi:POT family proton-dependent oligopeptide transporter